MSSYPTLARGPAAAIPREIPTAPVKLDATYAQLEHGGLRITIGQITSTYAPTAAAATLDHLRNLARRGLVSLREPEAAPC